MGLRQAVGETKRNVPAIRFCAHNFRDESKAGEFFEFFSAVTH
jgi:hypothetical protein